MEGGALPRLTHLYLNQNGIGDVGLRAFCAAIAKGTPLGASFTPALSRQLCPSSYPTLAPPHPPAPP